MAGRRGRGREQGRDGRRRGGGGGMMGGSVSKETCMDVMQLSQQPKSNDRMSAVMQSQTSHISHAPAHNSPLDTQPSLPSARACTASRLTNDDTTTETLRRSWYRADKECGLR